MSSELALVSSGADAELKLYPTYEDDSVQEADSLVLSMAKTDAERAMQANLLPLITVLPKYIFDGTTTIDQDGNVFLANTATEKDALLKTGKGINFESGRYINTLLKPKTTGDITVFFETTVSDAANPTSWGVLKTRTFGLFSQVGLLRFVVGGKVIEYPHNLPVGTKLQTASVVDAVADTAYLYVNGQLVGSATGLTKQNYIQALYIGAQNANGSVTNYHSGYQSGFYYIPAKVTAQEVLAHCNNPVDTLYKVNGVLTSGLPSITQDVLDAMVAGQGRWYPMTELCKGNAVKNHLYGDTVSELSDFSTPDIMTSDIVNEGAGRYSFNTTEFRTLGFDLQPASGAKVVEFEITSYTSGVIRTVLIGSTNDSTSDLTEEGVYRITLDTDSITSVRFLTIGSLGGFVGVVKVNSVYTPLDFHFNLINGSLETTHTGTQEQSTGYQTAFVNQDQFGLPLGKTVIDVEAVDLENAQAQFLSENGLTLIDNAGDLEITKA